MKKAYAYLRVSGKGQVDGDGFDRQFEAIREYAKREHLEIVKVFRENSVSGTLSDRPSLGDMLLSCQEQDVNIIVIERLDRLARDLMVQENLIADLRRRGVDLVSTQEPDDMLSSDPTRKLIRQMMGAIAEYDKNMLVLKLRAARERKRARGQRCEGALPFGTTDEEMTVVGYIKGLRRASRKSGRRLSFNAIAGILNDDGIPTKRGKRWTAMQVKRIVESPIFKKARVRHEPPMKAA